MTSPTGRIVSRVGVRVLPNTATFRRSLDRFLDRMERSLRVEIPAILDTRGLDADLRELKARIERTRPARIPVKVDEPTIPPTRAPAVDVPLNPLSAAFARQVRADVARVARSARATIPVQADADRFRREVATEITTAQRTARLQVPVDSDLVTGFRQRLVAKITAATRGIRHTVPVDVDVDRRGNAVTRLFSNIISMGQRIGSAVASGVSSGVGALTSLASSALSGATALAGMAVKAALLSPLLAGIAGAATAAGGAVAAGLGGLPVLLSSLLSPIAAVAVGIDGIGRAAQTIRPELDAIKKTVSDTFERGMLVVFEQLRPVLPIIEQQLANVAAQVSSLAFSIAQDLSSPEGMVDLRNAIGGVSLVIQEARGELQYLIGELLDVAGALPLYEILGSTIGVVALRLGQMLDRMKDSGDLQNGLAVLGGLLAYLTDTLAILAEGALKFLIGAGPGLMKFFEDLNSMLAQIDWAGLGETFGGLLERVGEALKRIPPETWERLVLAIGALAEKFVELIETGALEDMILNFARLVEIMPGVIDFLTAVASVIGGMLDPVGSLGGALDWVKTRFSELSDSISGSGIGDSLDGVGDKFWHVGRDIKDAVTDFMRWLGIASPSRLFAQIGADVLAGMLQGLAPGPGMIGAKLRELRQAAIDALSDAKDWLVNTGADMVMGFIRGIGSKIGDAARKAAEMARRAYDAAKSALGIASPSRLFAGLGRDSAEGYIVGLQDRYPEVDAAIARIFADIDGAAGRLGPGGPLADIPEQLMPTAEDIAEAFLRALSGIAVGSDEIAIMVNRARAQLARR